MSEAPMIIGKEIAKSPTKIAELIKDVADSINGCRDDLDTIKERGFFKKVFNNNTGDLADAMIKQNDAIGLFMNIIQAILFLNMNNTITLGKIADSLKATDNTIESSGKQYTQMAIDYIDAAVTAAETTNKKFDVHDKQLDDIKNSIIEKNKLDEEQSKKISELKSSLVIKDELDQKQSAKIDELSKSISDKDGIDNEQDKKILELFSVIKEKEKIDKEQSNQIKDVMKILEKYKTDIDENKMNNSQTLSIACKPRIPNWAKALVFTNVILSGILAIMVFLV